MTVQLYEVPDRLIPGEPRLGGACVPVPAARLRALERSGPVLLGRDPAAAEVAGFTASVVKELRTLLRLPRDHCCFLTAAPPGEIGAGLAGQGVRLVLAREQPAGDWRAGTRDRERWIAADLSRMSGVLSDPRFGELDVGVFCPSWLFGVNPAAVTVVVTSPRAAPAVRQVTVSTAELIMLGQAVRSRLESDLSRLEPDVSARFAMVSGWASARDWADCSARWPGGDLTALVTTSLSAQRTRDICDFLARNHIAYGLADDEHPTAFRVGLYDLVDLADLDRLLSLLDLLAARTPRVAA